MEKVKLDKSLVSLWNGIYSEVYEDRQCTVGKILTIIDAVIVDKEQNKSVKDLVKKSIWEDFERRTDRLSRWVLWFNDNVKIGVANQGSSVPYRYNDEDRNPHLSNYIK